MRRVCVDDGSGFQGDDDIYIGKARGDYQGEGRFRKGNAKMFAGRDNLLTGGWAGGEAALKLKARE